MMQIAKGKEYVASKGNHSASGVDKEEANRSEVPRTNDDMHGVKTNGDEHKANGKPEEMRWQEKKGQPQEQVVSW